MRDAKSPNPNSKLRDVDFPERGIRSASATTYFPEDQKKKSPLTNSFLSFDFEGRTRKLFLSDQHRRRTEEAALTLTEFANEGAGSMALLQLVQ